MMLQSSAERSSEPSSSIRISKSSASAELFFCAIVKYIMNYKPKKCEICGDIFYPKSSRQKYCRKPIKKTCEICGATFERSCGDLFGKTCSAECSAKLSGINMKKAIQSSTRICRACGKEFHPTNNTNFVCSDIHYRTCAVCGKQFVLDTSQYYKEWAVTCSPSCRAVLANGRAKKSGNMDKGHDKVRKSRLTPEQVDNYNKFMDDPRKFISESFPCTLPSLKVLSSMLGIAECTVGQYVNQYKIRDLVEYPVSNMEKDITDLIKTARPDLYIVHNDRNVIKPLEIDIYLPDIKLGIECNPTWTHNSSNPDPWGWPPKKYTYHKEKTDKAEEAGIKLIHIFGHEWEHKRDIVESIILNSIGANSTKIYARLCEVREVSSEDSRKFLDMNHRQGSVNCSIRLGLFSNDKLVSLMTFSRPRYTIGNNLKDSYELVRFCSLLNTTVVGGASKLFKYFVNNYSFSKIYSYSDRAHTSGKIYAVLGFEECERSDPGYVWVNINSDVAYSRINAQRANIRRFLGDNEVDLNRSESEIMESHGFVKVYDSGTIRWEFNL